MTATMAQLRTTLTIQMAMDRQRIAARVIELRERNRLTQEGLRDKSGLSLRTIQRVEKPNLKKLTELRHSTVEALAKALGVPASDIVPDGAVLTEDRPATTPDLMGQYGPKMSQIDRIEAKLNAILIHFEISAAEIERTRRAEPPEDEQASPRAA